MHSMSVPAPGPTATNVHELAPTSASPCERFIASLQSVGLCPVESSYSPHAATALRRPDRAGTSEVPRRITWQFASIPTPSRRGPKADFAWFRDALTRTPAILCHWADAATAGPASPAWTKFLSGITTCYFKSSRKQRVMDALMLSLDLVPPKHRADALACLLADGIEGRAAAEEFWRYVGLKRIPDVDKARVEALIRRYQIGA